MIKQYNPENLSRSVKYTVRGTYLFDTEKVVIETSVIMNGNIFGYDVLKTFVTYEPDFFDDCQYIQGNFAVYDGSEATGVEVFDNHKKIIAYCYGLDELQEHLVAVEIVKVEELGQNNG